MASELTQAMIVNAIVLVTVLATDLGPARRLNRLRILRPLLAAAVIIPIFLDRPVGHGTGLAVEIAGCAAGLLGGLLAAALVRVYRQPGTGAPVTAAGGGYAALWLVVVGARVAFSYGAQHWFSGPLVSWATNHDVTVAAITDGLILMAVTMVVTRTVALVARSRRLPATPVAVLAQPV